MKVGILVKVRRGRADTFFMIAALNGKERTMAKHSALLRNLLADETGGEVLEYALIAGLIIVAAIAVITSVGTKVLARWTSLNSSL